MLRVAAPAAIPASLSRYLVSDFYSAAGLQRETVVQTEEGLPVYRVGELNANLDRFPYKAAANRSKSLCYDVLL